MFNHISYVVTGRINGKYHLKLLPYPAHLLATILCDNSINKKGGLSVCV